jgi:hypothetical protein
MLTEFATKMIEAGGFEGVFLLSLAMIMGHMLADYPLQGEFLAVGKNRHSDPGVFFGGKGAPQGLWIHALTAHCLIHAGIVWLITGSYWLALIELVLHWITDFIRCENWIGYHTDQAIHIACKIAYACLLVYGVF